MTNARRRTDNWEHVDCFRQVTQNVKKVRWQAISSRQTQIPGNSKNYGKKSTLLTKPRTEQTCIFLENAGKWQTAASEKNRNWTSTLLGRTMWQTGLAARNGAEQTLYWQQQKRGQQDSRQKPKQHSTGKNKVVNSNSRQGQELD